MAFKNIKCPWCGKEARITYEENRVYQMKCYSCRNTMLHVDHSFDSAVDFFEHHANLLQAEQDGRLVVLPEPLKRAIVREGGRCFSDFTMDDINNLLEAWDAGRLVVLPCKVGDTVYVIGESCDFCETYLDEPERCMRCEKGHYVEERGFELWMLSELNESIFLTREEADAALAGKGGDV